MLSKERRAQEIARHARHVLVLGLYGCDLHEFLAFDDLLGQRGVEQDIGQQFESEIEVRLHHFQRNAETVVARFAADAAAHRFDLLGDFFGAPGRRPLEPDAGK